MGSAALRHVASRGASVIGLDRFEPGHTRGSSHGGSRVFRQAYFEDPAYVDLLRVASDEWIELEARTGRSLLRRCGVLLVGFRGTSTVAASREAATRHGLQVQVLDRDAIRSRWPIFDLPEDAEALHEPDAGFVDPEAGIAAHLELARLDGAGIRRPSEVISIEPETDSVTIRSRTETIRARRAIVTAGAWTKTLLDGGGCSVDVTPHRKVIAWMRPRPKWVGTTSAERCPCWLIDDGGMHREGVLYGVPTWSGQRGPAGVKMGFHGSGTPVDPGRFDRTVTEAEISSFRDAAERRFPGVFESPHAAKTCLYTMSRDEHFVVDRLPGAETICVAAGLSGHGYKFAPVLGRVLADLALDGGTPHPIDFLSLARFGG